MDVTLGLLHTRYLASRAGAHETSTQLAEKIHLDHLVTTLGKDFPLRELSAADLQRHVDRRKAVKTRAGTLVSPATIRTEVAGLRAAWN